MVELSSVTKTYRKGDAPVRILGGLSRTIADGEFLVVYGPSGSGKSTLLLILGGMLRPSAGTVSYKGEDIYRWSTSRRNAYRKYTVGFMFQNFLLLPYLSVFDNICIPLSLRGDHSGVDAKITAIAKRFNIEHRLLHRPTELSIGEQQRVALARALIGGPEIILADEPTGNLDAANTGIIADCLREEHRRGRTVVLVTHDPSLMDIGTSKLSLSPEEAVHGTA